MTNISTLRIFNFPEDYKALKESLARLKTNPGDRDSKRQNSYLETYPKVLAFFKDSSPMNEDRLIQGALMVYGWMPTIPVVRVELAGKALEIIRNAKDETSNRFLNAEDLTSLSKFMNNSIVGTSKLLHFIYPERYAIWDSKVAQALHGDHYRQHRVNRVDSYLEYLEYLDHRRDEFNSDRQSEMAGILKYSITEMRFLEMVLFVKAVSK